MLSKRAKSATHGPHGHARKARTASPSGAICTGSTGSQHMRELRPGARPATSHCFVAHCPINVVRIEAPYLLKSSQTCPASTKAPSFEYSRVLRNIFCGRLKGVHICMGVQMTSNGSRDGKRSRKCGGNKPSALRQMKCLSAVDVYQLEIPRTSRGIQACMES